MSVYEDRLRAAGIPFVSAGERPGEIVWIPGVGLTDEQAQIVSDIELELFHPEKWAQELERRQLIADLRDSYLWAINRCDEIRALPEPSAVNLATLKVIANATKDLALVEKRMLQFLKNQFV